MQKMCQSYWKNIGVVPAAVDMFGEDMDVAPADDTTVDILYIFPSESTITIRTGYKEGCIRTNSFYSCMDY